MEKTKNTKARKKMRITIELDSEKEILVMSCVSSALASLTYGIGYWADVRDASPSNPAICFVRERETSSGKPGQWLPLRRADIERGLARMALTAPKIFGRIFDDNGDAPAGDILIQYALLGEERYG